MEMFPNFYCYFLPLYGSLLQLWQAYGFSVFCSLTCQLPSVLYGCVTIVMIVTGYCFLLFQEELSVQALIEACLADDGKLYWCVTSPTMKDKPVSVLLL